MEQSSVAEAEADGLVRAVATGMEYSIHSTSNCYSSSFGACLSTFLDARSMPAGMPPTHKREIQGIFPDQDVSSMLIVPTCQKTVVDLVNRGEKVDQVKDDCLERFVQWAELVCEPVSNSGYWIDFIDPCSGLPVRFSLPVWQNRAISVHCCRNSVALQMRHRHYNQPYSEVDGMMVLQKYDVHNAGSCKVVIHPQCAPSYIEMLCTTNQFCIMRLKITYLLFHEPQELYAGGSSVYPATLFAICPWTVLQLAIDKANAALQSEEGG